MTTDPIAKKWLQAFNEHDLDNDKFKIPDESVIKQCAEIQSEYFSFQEKIQGGLKPEYQSDLISAYQCEIAGKKMFKAKKMMIPYIYCLLV